MFLLEAMASGVPVVQPRRGAFPEIVETTGGGMIVEADNPEALADGLLDAVARSRARRRARRGRRRRRARALQRRTGWPKSRRSASTRDLTATAAASRRTEYTCSALSHISKSYPTPRGDAADPDGRVADARIAARRSRSWGRRAAARARCSTSSARSTPPSSGTVTLDGQDPFALGEREQAAFRNQHIGFVFQDHSLLPQCSVLENVLAPTLVAPPPTRARHAIEARARELLDQVGLGDRLDHRPGELSGGEKQRAAIARALIRNPLLLLCDEPTGNLDRASADIGRRRCCSTCTQHARRSWSSSRTAPRSPSGFPSRYEM